MQMKVQTVSAAPHLIQQNLQGHKHVMHRSTKFMFEPKSSFWVFPHQPSWSCKHDYMKLLRTGSCVGFAPPSQVKLSRHAELINIEPQLFCFYWSAEKSADSEPAECVCALEEGVCTLDQAEEWLQYPTLKVKSFKKPFTLLYLCWGRWITSHFSISTKVGICLQTHLNLPLRGFLGEITAYCFKTKRN